MIHSLTLITGVDPEDARGMTGDLGFKGSKGAMGPRGPKGDNGTIGDPGPQPKGDEGLWCFETVNQLGIFRQNF